MVTGEGDSDIHMVAQSRQATDAFTDYDNLHVSHVLLCVRMRYELWGSFLSL